MCNHETEDYCQSFLLAMKLENLISKQFTTDQNGVNYVRTQLIENLINELECEDV